MQTLVFPADDPRGLELAVAALCRGELVAFPTDTVYGVGCNPWRADAISALYAAKERPQGMAIPVLLANAEAAGKVARCLPDGFDELADRFWPGGLTIVVPREPDVPATLCAGGDTIAVRLPDHPVPRALAQALGGCLAATSANRSGEPPAVDATAALQALEGWVAVLLDGGRCPKGVASSVVDLTADPPRLVRRGQTPLAALTACVPGLVFDGG
jgi:L-threonylcarbamoyladenylate synthase